MEGLARVREEGGWEDVGEQAGPQAQAQQPSTAKQQPRSHAAAKHSHAATQQPRSSHAAKQCSHSHAPPSPLSLHTQDYYARMAGFVTLYAALLQQSTCAHFQPPSEEMILRSVTNPLGMPAAWRWLARLLNQKPQRISATILLAFLKPSSHALNRAYPRQFLKLLKLIESDYLKKIHALIDTADAPEEKAALSNLETWLGNTMKELNARRPLVEPEEAKMEVFKEPDDTSEAGGDSW